MPYLWNNLRFEIPAGVVDQTVVTFVDDPSQPSFQLTVTADGRGEQAFTGFVNSQLQDLAKALPGYQSHGRVDKSIAGKSAVLVEHRARSPQGQQMRQRQAYVDVGERVAIITLTHADTKQAGAQKADAAFDQLLASLSA